MSRLVLKVLRCIHVYVYEWMLRYILAYVLHESVDVSKLYKSLTVLIICCDMDQLKSVAENPSAIRRYSRSTVSLVLPFLFSHGTCED